MRIARREKTLPKTQTTQKKYIYAIKNDQRWLDMIFHFFYALSLYIGFNSSMISFMLLLFFLSLNVCINQFQWCNSFICVCSSGINARTFTTIYSFFFFTKKMLNLTLFLFFSFQFSTIFFSTFCETDKKMYINPNFVSHFWQRKKTENRE